MYVVRLIGLSLQQHVMEKRLYRSRKNRMLSGVCGGLGEYIGIDPVVIRIIWAVLSVLGFIFTGIIVYLILILLIPEEPEDPGVIDAEFEVKED